MTVHAGRLAGRFLKSLSIARDDGQTAQAFIERSGWADAHVLKGAVSASTMGNSSALLDQVGQDFMEYVRAQTIVGRLQGFRRLQFQTRIARQSDGPTAYWVGERQPIPVVRASFDKGLGMQARKVAAIAVQTQELAMSSDGERIILNDLAKACAERLDRSFVDPLNAGSVVEPAAVTYGASSVSATSKPADDLADALANLAVAGGDVTQAAWLMRPEVLALLILTRVASEDGSLAGRPVLASTAVPGDTNGSVIVLVDPSGIELAGGVDAELTVAREGSLILDDDPDGTGAEGPVSLWQANSVGYRAVTPINWRASRQGAAIVITGVAY